MRLKTHSVISELRKGVRSVCFSCRPPWAFLSQTLINGAVILQRRPHIQPAGSTSYAIAVMDFSQGKRFGKVYLRLIR